MWWYEIIISALGRWRPEDSGESRTHWLDNVVESANLRPVRDPVLKHQLRLLSGCNNI